MNSHRTPAELSKLMEDASKSRVFYQIFPQLGSFPPHTVDWLEVVLSAEAVQPTTDPPGRAPAAALKMLADFLVQQVTGTGSSAKASVSGWYYTSLPPCPGQALRETRLFRSLSIFITEVVPYAETGQPEIRKQLESFLSKLAIQPIQMAR